VLTQIFNVCLYVDSPFSKNFEAGMDYDNNDLSLLVILLQLTIPEWSVRLELFKKFKLRLKSYKDTQTAKEIPFEEVKNHFYFRH
jgi:hypothetical protein